MTTDPALPAGILTTDRYEEQQSSARSIDKELGRDAFLRLFTTQLQNQNPLSPMDNEAFVAQLAQFSALESMKGMQQSIEDMAHSIKSDRFYSGANFLGRSVPVPGGLVQGGDGQSSTTSATLPDGVDSLLLTVMDGNGALVYSQEMGSQPAGTKQFTWPGVDTEGHAVEAGEYRMAVMIESDGQYSQLPVMGREQITAVRWDAESQELLLETSGGKWLKMSELDRVAI